MASKEFSFEPKDVPKVETLYRRIKTAIPAPVSLPILEKLRKNEPRAMRVQPPVLWDKVGGVNVGDRHGNRWLDWSSGVLVTNVGHGHRAIKRALMDYLKGEGALHNLDFVKRPFTVETCFSHRLVRGMGRLSTVRHFVSPRKLLRMGCMEKKV